MPRRGPGRVAHRPGTRGPRDALRPCDLYPAARPGALGAAEPPPPLWPAVSHGGPDPPAHRRGPEASRGGDRRLRRAAYLGPTTPLSSTFIIPGLVKLLILRKKPLLSDRIIPEHREFTGCLKMGQRLTNDLRL